MFTACGRAQEDRRVCLLSLRKLLRKEHLDSARKDFIQSPAKPGVGRVVLSPSVYTEMVSNHALQMPLCKLSFFSSFPTGFGLPVCTWTAL